MSDGTLQASVTSSDDDPLTLKHSSDFFECNHNLAPRKPDLAKSMNVREFLTSVFQQHNGFVKSKSALEQSNFMDDIEPSD